MNPGRILGLLAGIVILVAVFALPFGPAMDSPTLYGSVRPLLENLGAIQQSGDQAMIALTYVLIGAFILLAIAGVVGIFPLGSGVIGIIAMVVITLAPTLIYPGAEFSLATYGVGYFVAWIASIVALGASFWKARVERAPPVTVTVTPPPPPPPLPGVVVSPTITVTQTQALGEGKPARPEEVPQAKPAELPPPKPGETTPGEVVQTIDSLKQQQESGKISAEQLQGELRKLMFKDLLGKFWTVDFRTGQWVYHDGARWVEGIPPATLKTI